MLGDIGGGFVCLYDYVNAFVGCVGVEQGACKSVCVCVCVCIGGGGLFGIRVYYVNGSGMGMMCAYG